MHKRMRGFIQGVEFLVTFKKGISVTDLFHYSLCSSFTSYRLCTRACMSFELFLIVFWRPIPSKTKALFWFVYCLGVFCKLINSIKSCHWKLPSGKSCKRRLNLGSPSLAELLHFITFKMQSISITNLSPSHRLSASRSVTGPSVILVAWSWYLLVFWNLFFHSCISLHFLCCSHSKYFLVYS